MNRTLFTRFAVVSAILLLIGAGQKVWAVDYVAIDLTPSWSDDCGVTGVSRAQQMVTVIYPLPWVLIVMLSFGAALRQVL